MFLGLLASFYSSFLSLSNSFLVSETHIVAGVRIQWLIKCTTQREMCGRGHTHTCACVRTHTIQRFSLSLGFLSTCLLLLLFDFVLSIEFWFVCFAFLSFVYIFKKSNLRG